MITVPHIDVMKNHGRTFITTLHNVRVRGIITVLDDNRVCEIPTLDAIAAAAFQRLPSLQGRIDIRLRPYS